MATKKPKGTTSAKKAAPKKAASKPAPNLSNQPSAPKKATVAKPKYTIKGTQVSSNLPAVRQNTLPAVTTRNLPVKYKGKAVPKNLATRLGTALSKTKGKGKMIGTGLLAAGAAYAAYKAGKPSSSATKSKPVSILKGVNRRDDVGKPLTPTVIKKGDSPKPTTPTVLKKGETPKPSNPKSDTPKPSTPKPKPNNPKKQEVKPKATPEFKRDVQMSEVKTLGAKDIKPTYSKMPEVKNVNISKPSTDKPKYSKERIARMENRAGRKAERMSNRAGRAVERASKLVGKLKYGGSIKAKNGKKFPDLNKDGKITKADILKGRGVIAKKGASVRKAAFGDMLGKAAGSGMFGLAGMAANKMFGGKKKPVMGGGEMPTAAPAMKKGGKVAAKKKMMKSGGKMDKCKYGCK